MKKLLIILAMSVATMTAHADTLANQIIKQSQVRNYNLCMNMLAVDFIHLQEAGRSTEYLEQWRKRNEKDCEAYLPKN
jgi:dimeric dUTPase (all-alpha-NTP-PPase superfamily)